MSQTLTETFRTLHVPGDPFIMGNVWDMGSARMLAAMGAKALATSSAAHAFTLGVPDSGFVSRKQALEHAHDIVHATPLPVSGDLENGYGHNNESVAETVLLAAKAGLAGCGIEDIALPDTRPYDFAHAVERIEAAASAARSLEHDFVLTARADGVMYGQYDLAEAIRRIQAFEAAGADVLFVPMPGDFDALIEICRAVKNPVNAICVGAFTEFNRDDFARIGVARISLGSSLARVTHRAIIEAGRAVFDHGIMSSLSQTASSDEVDSMLMDYLPKSTAN